MNGFLIGNWNWCIAYRVIWLYGRMNVRANRCWNGVAIYHREPFEHFIDISCLVKKKDPSFAMYKFETNVIVTISCCVASFTFINLSWSLYFTLFAFDSERKHGKAHRVPSLVNRACRSKKGEFGGLVAKAQVWWPYIVAHLDHTSIFTMHITRLKFRNNH
jgi:hypothetical protein